MFCVCDTHSGWLQGDFKKNKDPMLGYKWVLAQSSTYQVDKVAIGGWRERVNNLKKT